MNREVWTRMLERWFERAEATPLSGEGGGATEIRLPTMKAPHGRTVIIVRGGTPDRAVSRIVGDFLIADEVCVVMAGQQLTMVPWEEILYIEGLGSTDLVHGPRAK